MPILDLRGAKPPINASGKRLYPRKREVSLPLGLLTPNGSAGGAAAAKVNRLTMDFLAQSRSADQDLFGDNRILRARARKLALDSPFARKFLQMVDQNIVGPSGILMQAKVTNDFGKQTAETKRINLRIEQEWNRWGKRGRCTADGRFSFLQLQRLAVKNAAREGENLTRDVYGKDFNDTGYALQLLDNDQLDDTYVNKPTGANGVEIRMGVEVNQYMRPQAYWIYNGHPNDPIAGRENKRVRISADQVTHTALIERPGQTRGYSWMTPSILAMNQLGRYDEAVVVAARASAAKFLVIEQQVADGYTGDEDEEGNDTNADGTQLMTANAGEALVLDPGQTGEFIDPRFPTNNHEAYMRTCIRNIATGLLISYPTLGNDLAGVNFSSIRAGMLDERDCWRILQRWFIESFIEPIFAKWLKMALLTTLSDIRLTAVQMEQVSWKARGWDWVDPLKDAQAIVLKLQNGLITYADALAALGLDFEETMTERAMEQAFVEALGLTLGTDIRGQADTATDDSMSGGDGGDGKDGNDKQGSGGQEAKPKRVVEIELARQLFRDLRAAA